MTHMSGLTAEEIFLQPHIGKTAFRHVPVDDLRNLCDCYGITVVGTARRQTGAKTKVDYIKALLSFVSLLAMPNEDILIFFHQRDQTKTTGPIKLGAKEIQRISMDVDMPPPIPQEPLNQVQRRDLTAEYV